MATEPVKDDLEDLPSNLSDLAERISDPDFLGGEKPEEQKAEKEPEAKAEKEEKQEERPEGVLLKDGKTVIPYHVLEAERRRADQERRAKEAAEAARREAEERAERLAKEVESFRKDPDATPKEGDDLRAKVNALKEAVPEVGEVVDAILAKLEEREKEIVSIRLREEERMRIEQEEARRRVQEAIDRNPKLLYIQQERPDLFAEAVKEDRFLRESENPAVRALTIDQRFEKVVERLEMLHGEIQLPEKYRPAKKEDVKTGPNVRRGGVMTLSDLPGGAAPATKKRFEEMTPNEMASYLERQIDSGKSMFDIISSLEE